MKKSLLIYGVLFFILVIYVFRTLPFFNTDVPLGYDPGLYKTVFETFYSTIPNIDYSAHDMWSRANPIGLFLLTNILYLFSYTTQFLLTYFFAFLSSIISVFVYLLVSSRFPKYKLLTIFVSFAFFFISISQYYTFFMNYYKNVLGIILLLTSILLMKKGKLISALPLGFLIAVHRPTALFGAGVLLVYILKDVLPMLLSAVKSKKENRLIKYIKNSLEVKAGLIAIVIGLPLYFYNYQESLLAMLSPVSNAFGIEGTSGTFFSLLEYLYRSIWFWPFAIFGLVSSVKKKKFSYIESGFVFGLFWVIFHMFFYNRMIIQLDVFLILMSAIGMLRILTEVKKPNFKPLVSVVIIYFVINGWWAVSYAKDLKPLIKSSEFDFIQTIPDITEENAIVVSTHKNYSPWLIGYSSRDILAPGLFDLDIWEKEMWVEFWNGDGVVKSEMLKDYSYLNSPLYIYEGIRQPHYSFENSDCFEYIKNDQYNFIKFICYEN